MKELKKQRAALRKELKEIDKKLNKVKKTKKKIKEKIIIAEKSKLQILGKKAVGGGQNEGHILKRN
tara:strand:- start:241 stop:438 length:198 start_codon:yes stop_codon:yes gene_type:complete